MITEMEILTKVQGLTTTQLSFWVSEEWVRPAKSKTESSTEIVFSDVDIARVRLLVMLCNDLEVGNEAVPVILSLIDQVHDMREQLRIISCAIEEQPDNIRHDILKCARRFQES